MSRKSWDRSSIFDICTIKPDTDGRSIIEVDEINLISTIISRNYHLFYYILGIECNTFTLISSKEDVISCPRRSRFWNVGALNIREETFTRLFYRNNKSVGDKARED